MNTSLPSQKYLQRMKSPSQVTKMCSVDSKFAGALMKWNSCLEHDT